jgi:hypothetical protein
MAATIDVCESNGATETITHTLAVEPALATSVGSIDAPNLDPVANRLTPGANSYEKWQRVHVVALGGAAAIRTLKVWAEGTLSPNTTHQYNGSLSQATYDTANHKQTVYAQPTTTATRTPELMPTSEPASPNLGIGGSLTGALTAPGYSDYVVHQVRTTASATVGATISLVFGYEEVA